MALWTGLGQAATVAQLVGADVGGLISMIVQSALTARQNRSECEQLARRALMIEQLLPHVQEPEAALPLARLGDTLRDAHELVLSCQGRSAAYQFVTAGRTAERFREVQSKIDSYLIVFPVISHIGITRRIERIYNVLVPDDSTRVEPSTLLQQQESTEDGQEVPLHGTEEFTLAEILAATNNFALDTVIGKGAFGTVYRGRLHDGREVAIKRLSEPTSQFLVEQFLKERDILSRLRHKHIVGLLGSCATVSKDCEGPEEPEMVIVYEMMENGTLYDHLHHDHTSWALSRVRVSWKVRIDVLLGVSRAIEHLHCHANPRIIHRDIKSTNILLDDSWVTRVSDFSLSVAFHTENEESGIFTGEAIGTLGYFDPEYAHTGCLKPTSDVYNLGVVMLQVLTGKKAYSKGEEELGVNVELASFALPVIEAGNFKDLLDRRPVPELTARQLQALEHVAQTARCCVKLNGEDRPAISDVVANLEMAHELICRDEPGLVDELPNSPRASNVSSASYYSDLGCEVLEDGFDTNI